MWLRNYLFKAPNFSFLNVVIFAIKLKNVEKHIIKEKIIYFRVFQENIKITLHHPEIIAVNILV
jgi:hypothetical protein